MRSVMETRGRVCAAPMLGEQIVGAVRRGTITSPIVLNVLPVTMDIRAAGGAAAMTLV